MHALVFLKLSIPLGKPTIIIFDSEPILLFSYIKNRKHESLNNLTVICIVNKNDYVIKRLLSPYWPPGTVINILHM